MSRRKATVSVARLLAVATLALSVLLVGGDRGLGASISPEQSNLTAAVKAIILDPYDGCFVGDDWLDLNANWSKYGSVPLSITTGGNLCKGSFDLADLRESGADTVILDSTAFNWTLSADEIRALQTYLEEGHTLVGEDTVFQWKTRHTDNALAPLFGLHEQSTWYKDGLHGQSPTYQLSEQDPDASLLLRQVANPYVSSPHGVGQKPSRKKWRQTILNGARYLGITLDKRNAITVYDGPGYAGIYIASEAAFYSTPDDLQFLYNALIFPQRG